jgi:hypothetical protein
MGQSIGPLGEEVGRGRGGRDMRMGGKKRGRVRRKKKKK